MRLHDELSRVPKLLLDLASCVKAGSYILDCQCSNFNQPGVSYA